MRAISEEVKPLGRPPRTSRVYPGGGLLYGKAELNPVYFECFLVLANLLKKMHTLETGKSGISHFARLPINEFF